MKFIKNLFRIYYMIRKLHLYYALVAIFGHAFAAKVMKKASNLNQKFLSQVSTRASQAYPSLTFTSLFCTTENGIGINIDAV